MILEWEVDSILPLLPLQTNYFYIESNTFSKQLILQEN